VPQEDLAESLSDPERVLWHLADHLGTTRDLVDHAGALVEHYEYDSLGTPVSGDSLLTRYLFVSVASMTSCLSQGNGAVTSRSVQK
jgi:hypothetical protein